MLYGLSLILLLGTSATAFRVKNASPSVVKVDQGNPFKVICKTDDWYEFCTFRRGDKFCNIDWNYGTVVTMGECDDFRGRVDFRGDYDKYECGLEISRASLADTGEWSGVTWSLLSKGGEEDTASLLRKSSMCMSRFNIPPQQLPQQRLPQQVPSQPLPIMVLTKENSPNQVTSWVTPDVDMIYSA